MPLKVLFMIFAFIAGIIFDYFNKGKYLKVRKILQQITTVYLLFKIGFFGGGELVSQQWQAVFLQTIVAIAASALWTLFVLILLKRWSSFKPITQISIATHFGSVSVGTFIAAIAYLGAMKIDINPTAVVWLSVMEFPAIIVGMWKLGVRADISSIIKEKWALAVLPIAIVLGMLFGNSMPSIIKVVFFEQLFIPILMYFLFEMGCKASDSLGNLKDDIRAVFFVGIAIPIIGGITGSAIGYWMGYNVSGMFIMAILMASASYVLAPLCMYEVLKSMYKANLKIAKEVVSTSMALSVGVTLPFNILIGFKLYYLIIKIFQSSPMLALFGLILPFLLAMLSMKRWR